MRRWRAKLAVFLPLLLLVAAVVSLTYPGVSRASFSYYIPKQQDQLTINKDGAVTLVRYFEFFVDSTSTDSGTEIWAGLPTSSTTVSSVVDEDGKKVSYNVRNSGGEYVVTLKGFTIKPGTGKGFTVTATIPNFIFRDTRNQGHVTMQYSPAWWSSEVKTQDIAVILPGTVTKEEIKTGAELYDGIAQTESGAYVVTWQFRDLGKNEKVSINIGFPEKHVTLPVKEEPPAVPGPVVPPGEVRFPGNGGIGAMVGLVALVGVGMLVLGIIRAANREAYSEPEVRMEGVGVNETLSPIEVSVLLKQPPEKTLTLLLFELIKKRAVRVTSSEPLKIEVGDEQNLGEAEKLFLEALNRSTGELESAKLVPCFRYLAASLNEKMRPYCRRDTEGFYRGLIQRKWDEVTAAGTPDLKLEVMDRNMLWLLQDEDRLRESENQFPRDTEATVLPAWWLYGFMFGRPGFMYHMWPGMLYGQFNGIYGDILGDEQQRFREITEQVFRPAAPHPVVRSSHSRGNDNRGGFTPPSCACACACVSCACACACAGGGGCT